MTVVVNSQQHAEGTTAATTQAITPTGIVAGRSLLLLVGNAGGGSTGALASVADTGGNAWFVMSAASLGVTSVANTRIGAACVHNCVAPGTITATMGSIANRKLLLLEITGIQDPLDDVQTDSTAASSVTNIAPSATMTGADFVVAIVGRGGTANPTGITAGWTASTAGIPDLTAPILRAGWQEFSAAGASGTCGFTFAASAQAGLATIAFTVTPVPVTLPQHPLIVRRIWSGA